MFDAKEFGKRLRTLREDRKLTQREFAKALGLRRPQMSRIETGDVATTMERLYLAAEYFNVSIDYLMGRTDDQTVHKLHANDTHDLNSCQVPAIFADRLRYCRRTKGLTQVKAAAEVGLIWQQWQAYELRKSYPRFERLANIADLFEVSVDYLMGRTDEQKAHKLRKSIKCDFNACQGTTFAERLKSCRICRKFTQKQIASKLKLQERQWIAYEHGESRPKFEGLIAIADLLDVSLDYLVGRSDKPGCPTA